jgi:hypothetical protein
MEERTSVEAVQGAGFNRCAHAQPGEKRQVLLVDAQTLLEFQLAPGSIRENINTTGREVLGGQCFGRSCASVRVRAR